MKKFFALLVAAVLTVSTVSALDVFGKPLSVGATVDIAPLTIVNELGSLGSFAVGGSAFVDATYVGLDIGYLGGSFLAGLEVGVFGKYPFVISAVPGLSVYPKVGLDALIAFGWLTGFGLDITAGAGVDYDFTELLGFGLFVRAEVLFDAVIIVSGLSGVGLGPKIRIGAGYKL
jgi:hypothetical protein